MAPTDTNWLTVNGKADAELLANVQQKNAARLVKECFTVRDVAYVSKLWRPVIAVEKWLNPDYANRLRQLCKLSEVMAVAPTITSHRKFIGRFIVKGKQLITPIIQQLLKPYLLRQRAFNQGVVAAYAELASLDTAPITKQG